MNTQIDMETADELVMDSEYGPILDGDFEVTEDGYTYGLEDGTSVTVLFSGEIVLNYD